MLDIDLHVYHGMQTSWPDFEYPNAVRSMLCAYDGIYQDYMVFW